MARPRASAVLRRFHVLFQAENLSGMSDRQLLEQFLSGRDDVSELAFTALVQRHGRMVLGVCRRVLNDPDEAEDAFQATFLVLIRKARSIRVEGSVGRWLYGVATRVAVRGKARCLRREAREAGGVELLIAPAPTPRADDEDLRAVIADELNRLPVKFQMPLALCDLEGLAYEEAARRLGVAVGTIKSRLSRARARLRSRLSRRGLTPADFLGAGAQARTRLPDALVDSTVRLAQQFLTGQAGLAAIAATSATVAALTRGVIRSMFFTKLRMVAASIVIFAASGALLVHQATAQRPGSEGEQGKATQPRSSPAPGEPAARDDELDVLTLERAWIDALGRADGAIVGRILADDFLAVDASGGEFARVPYLRRFADGGFAPGPVERADLKVQLLGETAVLRNRSKFKNAPEILYTKVYAKRQGRWRCVASQETQVRESRGMMMDPGEMMRGRMMGMGSGGMMGMMMRARQEPAGMMRGTPANMMMPGGPAIDPSRLIKIRPRFEGLLETIHVKVGQAVKKGDPLAELFSIELAKAKNDYLARKVQWENDRRLLELRQKLTNTGAISNQLWVDTQNQEAKSKLEFRTAREQLVLLGLDDASIARVGEEDAEQKARMTLRSPIAGNVSEVRAAPWNLCNTKDVLVEIDSSAEERAK
jgi:RNA polymerase sigma factor (sigma-70 family)